MNYSRSNKITLEKSPSGINGLDEITEGGLPKGRPTLIIGAAGTTNKSTHTKFNSQRN